MCHQNQPSEEDLQRGSLTTSYIFDNSKYHVSHHVFTSEKADRLARLQIPPKYAPGTDLMSKWILTDKQIVKLIVKVLLVCISLAFQGLILNTFCVGQHDRQYKRLEARAYCNKNATFSLSFTYMDNQELPRESSTFRLS